VRVETSFNPYHYKGNINVRVQDLEPLYIQKALLEKEEPALFITQKTILTSMKEK